MPRDDSQVRIDAHLCDDFCRLCIFYKKIINQYGQYPPHAIFCLLHCWHNYIDSCCREDVHFKKRMDFWNELIQPIQKTRYLDIAVAKQETSACHESSSSRANQDAGYCSS